MDIPTEIPLSINPTIDPQFNSVIYTFNNTQDIIYNNDGNILCKFPYSKGTWWTNFKYSVYPPSNQQLIMSLILITDEGYTYVIGNESFMQQNIWIDTVWPLLSVNTNQNSQNSENSKKCGLYLKIKPLSGDEHINISLNLLGYRNLFPKSNNYILISPNKTYQFVFTEYENDDGTTSGTMYNIEHFDYIRDIINNSFIVYLLCDY
jgi:hypothetical protein